MILTQHYFVSSALKSRKKWDDLLLLALVFDDTKLTSRTRAKKCDAAAKNVHKKSPAATAAPSSERRELLD